jgi:hypothetical protein
MSEGPDILEKTVDVFDAQSDDSSNLDVRVRNRRFRAVWILTCALSCLIALVEFWSDWAIDFAAFSGLIGFLYCVLLTTRTLTAAV